jgi:RNA polymerase sigma factor (sigma-70 family)
LPRPLNHDSSIRIPFDTIVEVHGAMVLRVCRAILGRADAEDAWSDTFLAAMRAYPDLDANANVEAWLVTIAKRKAIDVLRQTKRIPDPVEELPEIPLHDRHPSDRDDDLWEALEALPTKQREAIAYHYLAGFSYAETAHFLHNSEAAARRAAADGIKRLRSTYQRANE